jgi:hypothetical protein
MIQPQEQKEPEQRQEQRQEPEVLEEQIHDLEVVEEQTRIALLTRGKTTCKRKQSAQESNAYESRIQLKSELTHNQQFMSDQLRTLPHSSRYFQLIHRVDPVELGNIDDTDLEDCAPIQPNQPKQPNQPNQPNQPKQDQTQTQSQTQPQTPEFVSLQYIKFAHTWQSFLLEIQEKQPSKYTEIYFESIFQMFHLIKQIQSKSLVHFDLHKDTVLYNETHGTPVFASYSLMFEYKHLTHSFETLFPEYDAYQPWPVEILFLSNIAQRKEQNPVRWSDEKMTKEEINTLCEKFVQHPESVHRKFASSERRSQWQEELVEYFSKYENQNMQKIYDDLTQWSIVKTWDVYAIAVMVLLNQGPENKYIDVLNTIIYSMPDARPSIEYVENTLKTAQIQTEEQQTQHPQSQHTIIDDVNEQLRKIDKDLEIKKDVETDNKPPVGEPKQTSVINKVNDSDLEIKKVVETDNKYPVGEPEQK